MPVCMCGCLYMVMHAWHWDMCLPHACLHVCVWVYACLHACVCVCAHAHLCVCMCVCVCACACMLACMCVCCLIQYQFDTLFSTSYVLFLLLHTVYRKCLVEENFGKFLIKLLTSKTSANLCLFVFLMSWDSVKIWWTTSDSPNLPRFSSAKHSHYTVLTTKIVVQNVVCILMLHYTIHVRRCM